MKLKNQQQMISNEINWRINIWLSFKGCRPEIGSIDNITKPVIRLPHYLRKKFYKEFQGNDIDEKKVDLLKYSHSLDERLSEGHNQLH